jgi:hypothetical protein
MIYQLLLFAFPFLAPDPTFRVENQLDIARQEVVSISFAQLENMLGEEFDPSHLQILESNSSRSVLTQWVDIDQDGHYEELLFLSDIKELETKSYAISLSAEADKAAQSVIKTFARFVPERIDDIAWENDKVAFRTYGPEAQRLTDGKLPGGTLTSGIDAWMKRVDYPIIDKWYQKYVDGGSYHKDSGEGYDPYHVGNSRGIGGVGIWIDDSLYVSKNFISYKILANGPLRSTFELSYAPWMAGKTIIKESKRISLDLGSQLYHMKVSLKSDNPVPNLTTGITLHDGTGEVNSDPKVGWISYWETIDDTKLGTGLIADPADILQKLEVRTAATDQSHIYLILKHTKKISYYAGFGWEKAGEFYSLSEWNQYLMNFSKKLATPLILKFE